MKKLLAMYICVSAFFCGFNAKASGFDMPPLDNSHTQFSLVPESLFDNSSSYQEARTYFMPDYQRNLVGRVNDGGKTANDKTCSTYGLLDSCAAHRVGKGAKHPIAGLTCYEECVCDTSYYKYTKINCRLPKTLSEGCTDEKKVDIVDGGFIKDNGLTNLSGTRQLASSVGSTGVALSVVKYAQCACPAEYNLSNCPTGFTCTECDGKYKQTGCDTAYNRTSPLVNADCESCVYNGTTKYKCACKSGYMLSGDTCVANCGGYGLTVCPSGCNCEACPQDSSKYKITSAKTADGWSWISGQTTCSVTACPAGYTAGVTTCSDTQRYVYSSNGKSGGKICGKCTAKNDDCPSGYSKTTCTSTQKQVGTTTTEAGTTCYKCEDVTLTCPTNTFPEGSLTCKYSYERLQGVATASDSKTTCYFCIIPGCQSVDASYVDGPQSSDDVTCQEKSVPVTIGSNKTCYKCVKTCASWVKENFPGYTIYTGTESYIGTGNIAVLASGSPQIAHTGTSSYFGPKYFNYDLCQNIETPSLTISEPTRALVNANNVNLFFNIPKDSNNLIDADGQFLAAIQPSTTGTMTIDNSEIKSTMGVIHLKTNQTISLKNTSTLTSTCAIKTDYGCRVLFGTGSGKKGIQFNFETGSSTRINGTVYVFSGASMTVNQNALVNITSSNDAGLVVNQSGYTPTYYAENGVHNYGTIKVNKTMFHAGQINNYNGSAFSTSSITSSSSWPGLIKNEANVKVQIGGTCKIPGNSEYKFKDTSTSTNPFSGSSCSI